MKIKPYAVIGFSVAITLAGIFVAQALGLWTTESAKVPRKYGNSKNFSQSAAQGTALYDPADIRGSYSFSEISGFYGVPLEDLAAAFTVESDKAALFKCKELEALFSGLPHEIGTGSVKMFVAYYLGLPYELTEDTYLPAVAIRVLAEKSAATPEQLRYAQEHTLDVP